MLLIPFNLRLGWWLGNPKREALSRDRPKPGLWPALEELAGQANDRSKWVYISDGGHFENLGLYEMVSRGCRRIVVSNAGCDPGSAFEDLGNAVRKIYVDLGVSIDFKTFDMPPRKSPPEPGFYCALDLIRYPDDHDVGWLLYLKPGYCRLEPAHVRSYAIAHETFPHESDGNRVRLQVFLASAPVSAVAGWLYAYQRAYVGFDLFDTYFLVLVLTAVIVAGRRVLLGRCCCWAAAWHGGAAGAEELRIPGRLRRQAPAGHGAGDCAMPVPARRGRVAGA